MPPLNKVCEDDESLHYIPIRKSIRVTFDTVDVREYERTVGDHPETKIGPPIALGWGYVEGKSVPLDQFELQKRRKGIRRMTSVARRNILQLFGVPDDEILQAENDVQKIQKSRERTRKQGSISGRTESAVRNIKRTFKRSFSRERLFKGFAEAQNQMYPISVI
mmetsp:Transcript_30524/g.46238  ORF Transcript_30524/g.46238 Transcript_30524/m.46238 type:complete len:164 (-) Transcript_30524:159-650(-)